MQRSSPSIGNLAAALAKAQPELINPEKSLSATIRSEDTGGAEQSFRYAPLSSGLEIVRKTLGQHEIATMQTTSIDQVAGIVSLTTVLAHASGEWIASDWPVCTISETATPHRMGAALTYARRYALFTLVGIAGEDDLDAPDLTTPTNRTAGPEKPSGTGNGRLNGGHGIAARRTGDPRAVKPVLTPEASAQSCDRLLAELNNLGSADDAAIWAHRSLGEKNKLRAPDAQRVEEAFQARLATLAANAAERGRDAEGAFHGRAPVERKGHREAKDSSTVQGGRQECPHLAGASTDARPAARQIGRQASLPDLRPTAVGRPPSAICPNPRARPQGQR